MKAHESHSWHPAPAPALWADLLLVLALIGACYWLIWPVGEYAILDDWAFNLSLKNLHERGELRIPNWNPMALIGHLFWGELFVRLFGFSFTVTRLSVTVLHVVECLALVRWLRWCGAGNTATAMALLTLIFHPLHFQMCYSFDTDITALSTQLLGMALIARGLAGQPMGLGWLLAGSLMLGWSSITRQHGATAILAIACYLLLWDRRAMTRLPGLTALMPGSLISAAFWCWYHFIHHPTDMFDLSIRVTRAFMRHPPWGDLPQITLTYAIYLGSFCMAIAAAMPLAAWRRFARPVPALSTLIGAATLAMIGWQYFSSNALFPYMWNTITPYGLFEPDLYLMGDRLLLWGKSIGWIVTFAAAWAFVSLFASAFDQMFQSQSTPRRVTFRLTALWLGWQLIYLAATTPVVFDRHLIILAPTSVLLLALALARQTLTRGSLVRFALICIPLAYYCLAGTHDVHAESRLAFQAGRDLMDSGVPSARINGGYAFDGWHLYESFAKRPPVNPPPPWWHDRIWNRLDHRSVGKNKPITDPESAWWIGLVRPRSPIQYVITLSPLDSTGDPSAATFRILKEYLYTSGWSGRTQKIYVLERLPRP